MSNARNLANLLGTGSTIPTAKIADAAITTAKFASGAVTKESLPDGTALQVINLADTTEGSSTSDTYSEVTSNFRPAITMNNSSNKLLCHFNLNIWADVDDDTQGTVAGQVKIDMYVGGTFSATLHETGTNNIARGGQMRMSNISVTKKISPSSTSEITFRTYFRRSSGSRTLKYNTGAYTQASIIEYKA